MRLMSQMLLLAALAVSLGTAAKAQDFYKGKNVTFVIGFGVGNGYDTYSRAVARSIGKYLPGQANVIVQNMPGAGSVAAAAHTFSSAPKDGTQVAIVLAGAGILGLHPLYYALGQELPAKHMAFLSGSLAAVGWLVVAEVQPGGELKLAGLGVAPSNGLKRGVVVNIDATVQSIQQALKEAELMADCKISRVYTGITGSHIRGINSSGMVAVKDREQSVAGLAGVE